METTSTGPKKRNAVYAHKETSRRHPRGKAKTSARAIRLQQRRKECLDYRLQGHSYRAIGEALRCHPSVAHRHVQHTMKEIEPHGYSSPIVMSVSDFTVF